MAEWLGLLTSDHKPNIIVVSLSHDTLLKCCCFHGQRIHLSRDSFLI